MSRGRRFLIRSVVGTSLFLGCLYAYLGVLTPWTGGLNLVLLYGAILWIYRREWARAAASWGSRGSACPRRIRARMTPVRIVGSGKRSVTERARS